MTSRRRRAPRRWTSTTAAFVGPAAGFRPSHPAQWTASPPFASTDLAAATPGTLSRQAEQASARAPCAVPSGSSRAPIAYGDPRLYYPRPRTRYVDARLRFAAAVTRERERRPGCTGARGRVGGRTSSRRPGDRGVVSCGRWSHSRAARVQPTCSACTNTQADPIAPFVAAARNPTAWLHTLLQAPYHRTALVYASIPLWSSRDHLDRASSKR